jgi:hypothetical protein
MQGICSFLEIIVFFIAGHRKMRKWMEDWGSIRNKLLIALETSK